MRVYMVRCRWGKLCCGVANIGQDEQAEDEQDEDELDEDEQDEDNQDDDEQDKIFGNGIKSFRGGWESGIHKHFPSKNVA